MALHTITLDDLELTALNILLEGESEIMVESRLLVTSTQIEEKFYLIWFIVKSLILAIKQIKTRITIMI